MMLWSLQSKGARALRGIWWTGALAGSALLAWDVWQSSPAAGMEGSFRTTWLYQYRDLCYWWLVLPAILAWRRWLAVDRWPWTIIVAGHAAGTVLAGAVWLSFRVLMLLLANRLPLGFFPDVFRDVAAWKSYPTVAAIYAAVVVPVYAVEFYVRWRQGQQEAAELKVANAQVETRLVRANLDALKMQLHPHFLFNALNSVTALVRRGKNEEAEEAIAKLGDLLRRALEHKQDQLVTLAQELEFLDHYFAIERIRFQDRLNVSFVVADECRQARLPSLLLQPLVENAMKHGFSRAIGARTLRFKAQRQDDRLLVELYNDGPPLPAGFGGVGTGIGLRNVRARLEMIYGDRARLDLRNVDGGVLACVTVPFQSPTA